MRLPDMSDGRKSFVDSIMSGVLDIDLVKCSNPFYVNNKPMHQRKIAKANVMDFLNLDHLPVGCQVCPHCRANYAFQWTFRLTKELERSAYNGFFCTLTYEPAFLPFDANGNQTFVKSHHQQFIKRLRQRIKRITPSELRKSGLIRDQLKQPLKYYLISERGTHFKRVHYHVIFFNLPSFFADAVILSKLWTFGQVDVGKAEPASIAYVCAYLIDVPSKDEFTRLHGDIMRPYSCMSKGLGKVYLKTLQKMRFVPDRVPLHGKLVPVPRAYMRWLEPHASKRASKYLRSLSKSREDFRLRVADLASQGISDPLHHIEVAMNFKAESLLNKKTKSHNRF